MFAALYALLVAVTFISSASQATDRFQSGLNEAMANQQGTALVLDVETGKVLVSYRMDIAARRVAAPGSTVKPFTLLALLEAGLITERTAVACPDKVRIGGRVMDCSHPEGLGPLDPIEALAHSCNYFFIHFSERLPIDSLKKAFSQAGLNSPTGQWRSEVSGVVRQPASRETMQLMSVGTESIAVTPLALAEAYRMLASRLRNPRQVTPELQIVSKGLQEAVIQGTGQLAAVPGMRIAGKTGTYDQHAWFVGFAPAERPEIVVTVFLERGTGGTHAAPIAGRIFDAYRTSRAVR